VCIAHILINRSHYGISMSAENPTEISMNHNILVLDTLRRMRDAESGKHYEQYFTHFKFALQLVIPYISGEVRTDIEDDMDTLKKAIEQIKKDKALNDITRSKVITEVKRDFADNHKAFLMSALTKTGIVKVLDEGVVDFTKNDMDTVAHIIRNSGKGLEKSIEQALDGEKSNLHKDLLKKSRDMK